MKFKKMFIFICLIVCLFSMASIYAGDVSEEATVSADMGQADLFQSCEIEFENDLETSVENDNNETQSNDKELLGDSPREIYDFPSEINLAEEYEFKFRIGYPLEGDNLYYLGSGTALISFGDLYLEQYCVNSVDSVSVRDNINSPGKYDGIFKLQLDHPADGIKKFVYHFNITVTNHTEISVANDNVSLKVLEKVDSGVTLAPSYAGNLTYSSSNESVAVVEGGKIKAVGVGTAVITVSFAGDDTYAAAEDKTITVNVALNPASVSLNNQTVNLVVCQDFVFIATTVPEDLRVEFATNDSDIIEIDRDHFSGRIIALAEGHAIVSATIIGYGVYEPNITYADVYVTKFPTEIGVANDALHLKFNDEVVSGASLTPADAGNLTYSSSNESVAVVEGGKIKAVGVGTAVITVSFAGDDTYAAAEDKNITVNVSLGDACVTVVNDHLYFDVGENFTIVANTVPENLPVGFTSSNESVVAVGADGNVVAVGEGSANITLIVGGDGHYAENSTTVAVDVIVPNPELDVSYGFPSEIITGDKYEFSFYISDFHTGEFGPGTAEITFGKFYIQQDFIESVGTIYVKDEVNSPGTYRGVFKYGGDFLHGFTITVKNHTEISVANDTFDLKFNDEVVSGASLTPAIAGNLIYSSSNESVAVVKGGKIKAVGVGTAVITVSFAGNEYYLAAEDKNITVNVSLGDACVTVESDHLYFDVGENFIIVANTVPENLPVGFTSSDASVVAVGADGNVVAVGEGSANITLIVGGDGHYAENSTTVAVDVIVPNPELDASYDFPSEIITGNEYEFSFYISDSHSAVLGPGTAEITFGKFHIQQDFDDAYAVIYVKDEVNSLGTYRGVFKYGGDVLHGFTITVKNHTEISVANDTFDLKFNDEVVSGASLTPADAGNLTYSSSNESVAVVEGGKIKAVGVGTAVITVSFAGNEYYVATEDKNITVNVGLGDACVSVVNDHLYFDVGENFTIVANTVPENLPVGFTSSDESVVAVGADGNVVAVGEGSANITLIVGGDGLYAENSTTVVVDVIVPNPELDVSYGFPSEIITGNEYEFSFYISDFHTGEFGPGTAEITFGKFYIQQDFIESVGTIYVKDEVNSPGTYRGVFKYGGDFLHAFTITVKGHTEIRVANDTFDLKFNEEVVSGASLTPAIAGNLTYSSSNESVAVVEDGKIKAVGIGTAVITVSFAGNEYYAAAEDKTIGVTVVKIGTVLTVPKVYANYGDGSKLIATLTDENGNPIGDAKIKFAVSGGAVKYIRTGADGQASLNIVNLDVGNYTATITCVATDLYNKAKTTSKITVNKANVILTASDIFARGAPLVKFVATLKDANGNAISGAKIKIVINKVSKYISTDANGQVALSINNLGAGNYDAVVTFFATDLYNKATTTAQIGIYEVKTTLTASNVNASYKDGSKLVATLKDNDGYAIRGAKIKIVINKVSKYISTDAHGQVALSLSNLEVGNYDAVITLVDTNFLHNKATTTAKITIVNKISSVLTAADVTAYYKDGSKLTVTLKDANGNAISGAKIKIVINKISKYITTDANGQVTLSLSNLDIGNYTATITFIGDDVYSKATATAKISILDNGKQNAVLTAHDVTANYKDGSQLIATLKDTQGKAISGAKIKIVISNMVKYITTNVSGQASLNVANLNPGIYKATITFVATELYNKSTANAKVTINN